jgi:hypothetical protein
MADTKISALTASTTPLAGTEVLPIVQGGVTKQVSVANLTAGRAVSATSVTASTGNFIVGTSGQGIDFSATPGTGTSELLADYEEGTWTPTYLPSAGAFTSITMDIVSAKYVRIGNLVSIGAWIRTDELTLGTASGELRIGNLPFTATGYVACTFSDWSGFTTTPVAVAGRVDTADYINISSGLAVSNLTTGTSANKNSIMFSASYYVV